MTSFYDLKTKTLDGKPADLGQYQGQGQPGRQRGEQVRLHAAVRRAREAAARDEGQGLQRARLPEQRLRRPGAGHGAGDRHLLQAHLRRDLPDVREGRDEGGRRRSRRSTRFLGESGNLPAWNFSKYVVDKEGKIVAFFPSKVTPEAPELRAAIAKALATP